jgi:hypothetical protein
MCERLVRTALFLVALLAALALLAMTEACAQQKRPKPVTAGKKIAVQWETRYKGTAYFVIPYELVYPESHKKLQEMFEQTFCFFFVVVDNKTGSETIQFDPKSADFFVYVQSGQRTGVNLTNTFKDPAQDKKISKEFKEAYIPIEVPKGQIKWTLLVMSQFALGDVTSARWTFPGETPKVLKEKPLDKVDIIRYKLKPVPGTDKRSRK